MILKKQKTFNSKAQKLRRTEHDIKQGINYYKENLGYQSPSRTAEYIKASQAPASLKESAKILKSNIGVDQSYLKGIGRSVNGSDTSLIGKRGSAQKIGILGDFNKKNVGQAKSRLSLDKGVERLEQSMGTKTPIEKGDYIKRAARSLVGKETNADSIKRKANRIDLENARNEIKAEIDKIAAEKAANAKTALEAKAQNAIKAESKFATKKAEILAKRAKLANLKKAGKIGLGVGVAAGLGYGGYKAYQHFKNKKDDNTKG